MKDRKVAQRQSIPKSIDEFCRNISDQNESLHLVKDLLDFSNVFCNDPVSICSVIAANNTIDYSFSFRLMMSFLFTWGRPFFFVENQNSWSIDFIGNDCLEY